MTKTKIEIIDETVAFYSENTSRRAFTDGLCEYLTYDGRMCAVGRCLYNAKQAMHLKLVSFSDYSRDQVKFRPRWKKGYAGHESHFWEQLQMLHDEDAFWGNNCLTLRGKEEVNNLKAKWND